MNGCTCGVGVSVLRRHIAASMLEDDRVHNIFQVATWPLLYLLSSLLEVFVGIQTSSRLKPSRRVCSPGVSIASVALANQLNANLLRSWVKTHRDQRRAGTKVRPGLEPRSESTHAPVTTLVPIALQMADGEQFPA